MALILSELLGIPEKVTLLGVGSGFHDFSMTVSLLHPSWALSHLSQLTAEINVQVQIPIFPWRLGLHTLNMLTLMYQ